MKTISLTSKVLHHLWCRLSHVPSIQPTSDLNQSLVITRIFSSSPRSPISLFLTLTNPMYCLVLSVEFVSATLRVPCLISNYHSSGDLFVFSSHVPFGHLDQPAGGQSVWRIKQMVVIHIFIQFIFSETERDRHLIWRMLFVKTSHTSIQSEVGKNSHFKLISALRKPTGAILKTCSEILLSRDPKFVLPLSWHNKSCFLMIRGDIFC